MTLPINRWIVVLSLVLLCDVRAYGQEAPHAMPGATGAPGVWVPLELGREALGCLDAREPAARRLRLLEEQLELRGARITSLEASESELRTALVASETRAAGMTRELRSFRRSPFGMFAIGGGIGLALGGLLIGALALH